MSRARLILLWLLLAAPAGAAVDLSEYRTATYGPPTHYCDPTLSVAAPSGSGTSGDPWNMTRCMTEPVAGNVVGIKAGVSVDLPAPNTDNIPAFNPSHSGTSGSRIVYVTQWAAIGLSNVATNALRTEFRHAGVAPGISGGVGTGNGGPMLGAYLVDYITYDGFYIDMAEAYMMEDSGVIRAEQCRGITFKNFVIKGAALTVASNPIVYRPQDAVDTILSNFRVYDFTNDPTGSATPQAALFSDQYGDQNFLIEKGEIYNTQRGIFLKGSGFSSLGDQLNYGTIRYMNVHDVRSCYQFNALSTTQTTTLEYSLCYNVALEGQGDGGVVLSSETTSARNLTIDHVTVAKVDAASANTNGGLITRNNQLAAGANGVTITNNIIEGNNGAFGYQVYLPGANAPQMFNYNGYYRNGGTELFYHNGAESDTIAEWRTSTGKEANSLFLGSSPFTNRASDVYTIAGGHAALTASSTGGEIGAYGGSVDPGPDTNASSSTTGAVISGGVRFTGSVRIQ